MFNTLSKNLTTILEKLTKKGIVTDQDVTNALREVRISLLEADVALEVVKNLIENIVYINNSNFNGFTGVSIFFVIIFSTVSQIGDLIISYFKRQSDIKNTGNIIPGHGGLLAVSYTHLTLPTSDLV